MELREPKPRLLRVRSLKDRLHKLGASVSKRNQQKRREKLRQVATSSLIRGVDCGAGGLTRGLEAVGVDVRLSHRYRPG